MKFHTFSKLIQVFVILFYIIQIQAGSTSNTAKSSSRTRTSSQSSTTSLKSEVSEAAAGPSHLSETLNHPLLEPKPSKNVRIASSAAVLNDPMAMTRGRLDPTRDGVLARMRNSAIRYGTGAAVGYAVGVGGLEAKQYFFPNDKNNKTESMNNDSESINKSTTTSAKPIKSTTAKSSDESDMSNPL